MRRYSLASTTWDAKELEALEQVIKSGNFTMGAKVREFEQAFASYFGKKYAVMSNSGSSANLLAMAAIHYSKKSPLANGRFEVIVPAVSWSTTYYPITQMGYTLKFVDVNPSTLNMDLATVSSAISEKTAGIFAVNLLGNPLDLEGLRTLANERGLFLLEDNCESMGAKVSSKYAGSFGDIGTFSCFFSHHISTMEGGVCVTDDEELAQVMVSMRAHGWTRELPIKNHVYDKTGEIFDDLFRFVLPGYNLRPLEMSGAIGLEQLKKLPKLVAERRRNASVFSKAFSQFADIEIQQEFGESSWFGFSIILTGKLSGNRASLVKMLQENEIDCRPIVAGNFTKNPVMKHLKHAPLDPTPGADKVHYDGLFLGNHHYDLEDEILRAAGVVQKFISMLDEQ